MRTLAARKEERVKYFNAEDAEVSQRGQSNDCFRRLRRVAGECDADARQDARAAATEDTWLRADGQSLAFRAVCESAADFGVLRVRPFFNFGS